jgi:hypothetical protein
MTRDIENRSPNFGPTRRQEQAACCSLMKQSERIALVVADMHGQNNISLLTAFTSELEQPWT